MNKDQQGQRIVRLTRILAVVGLSMVLITTGFVGWTLAGMRRERAQATAEQVQLDEALHQLRDRASESQREIRTALDENVDWQPRSPSAAERFSELVRAQVASPTSASMIPLLEQLDGYAHRLQEMTRRVAVWRSSYLPVYEDLRTQRTMTEVRELIIKLGSAMENLEGRRRLDAAIEHKRWQKASPAEATRLAQDILLEAGRRESEGVTDFDRQLAELARLVELLGGEEQFDNLTDLKDNKLKPSLDGLTLSLNELVSQGVNSEVLRADAIEALKVALFGAGYRGDDLHQDIQPGRGGLFTLRRDALQLRRERDKLKAELAPLMQEVQSTNANLALSTQARSAALTQEMEQSLTSGWNHMLLFGGGCAVLFFWLAQRIARGIEDQVRTIELSRAEAEGSRQTAQQLMAEQQLASANLAAAHQELRTSEKRFRSLSDSAPIGIFQTDAEGACLYTNACWHRTSARPAEESLGMGWYQLILPEDAPRVAEKLQAAVADFSLYDCEYRISRPDGEIRWVHALAAVERTADGKISGSVGTIEDITERKRADEEMRKMHQELLETSRQAGMAEVATAVLHNVGNVLNSVNVASHCVADGVRRSRSSTLSRVAAMLREQEHDLGAFFTTDKRGRQLPGFLTQLADHLANEQSTALAELGNLQKNIEHIKEIVGMQQSFAKVSGVTETVQMADLVQDTLRLNANSLTTHAVRVECDFNEVPPVTVEKHKVIQILVNLLTNAKQACDAGENKDKVVKLRVCNGDGRVKISVSDNGVGITPENLARIFNHGFTTKKNGHGFGLHSGALAAREMGGALRVESEGPGYGATFTLELPCPTV